MFLAGLRARRDRLDAGRRRDAGEAFPISCTRDRVDYGADTAADANRPSGERGFVLLEEIVAISLLIVVMAALATFFLTVTQSTSYERARQSAVQLSNSEMDLLRGVRAGDLVIGRAPSTVNAQFAGAPAAVQPALATMTQASDPTTPVSSTTVPMTAPAARINNINYTITNYLGTCSVPTNAVLGTDCTNTAAALASGTPYLRAVVAVTWTGQHCPANLCSYVTSSLISTRPDPLFQLCTLGAACGPAAPIVDNPGDQFTTVRSAVSLQLALVPYTGVTPATWQASGLPSWLTMTPGGLITGTAPATAAAGVQVTVIATDAFLRTATATFTWSVITPPTITGLTTPFTTVAGTTIASQTLPYTCPTSLCTYTLAGAPAGIGLATSSSGTPATSQQVTNTSGNLYLVGTTAVSLAPSLTAYAADVAGQGASNYWRLGETSGTAGTDLIGGANLLEQAGVTHGAAGGILPSADGASTFDGAADGTASTTTPASAPAAFSESIWFKTTTTSGGRLIGFSNSQSVTSTVYDRHIYMDNAGHLDFGVNNGGNVTLASSGTYNDGQWHQAVGTLSGTAGMTFYVDGVRVGGNAAVTSATAATGYWRLGGDNLTTWPSAPSSNYFAGILDEASIYPSALTAPQVLQQYSDSGRVPFAVTVTPTDRRFSINGAVNQAAWTVNPPALPAVTGLATPFVTTAGARITAQPLPYTCATSNCSYALAGAPIGIGIATTGGGTGAASVTVTNGSGILYAVGTVSAATAPGPTAYTTDVKNQNASNYWRLDEPSGLIAIDSIGNNNLVEQSGVGHGAAGAILADTDSADTFDGSTAGYAATQSPVPAPGNFSESIWFRTTSTTGGKLIGFADQNTSPSIANDRQIYMDNSGHLTFGTWANNGPHTIATTGSFNDGQWHQAVGTMSTTSGLTFYVDGTLIGSDPTNVPYPSAGYWRIGGDTLTTSWPGTFSSTYFTGTLDDASIYPSALTQAQIQQQYADSGRVLFMPTVTPNDLTTMYLGVVNSGSWTVDSPPTVSGLTTPLATTVGATIAPQTLPYNCPLTACSYSVSGAPAGIGLSLTPGGTAAATVSVSAASGSIYLVGTVGAGVTPGAFTVTVTPKDAASAVTGTPATAGWTVYGPPTVTGLTALRTTVGATITAQSLPYTCPAAACTYTVSGAPAGIGLAATAGGTAATTVAVTSTSGSVYLVGTVAAAVTPGPFTVTVTPKDTASAVTGTPTAAAWTVYAQPSVTGLTTPFRTTVGAAIAPQTLQYSCPTANCLFTVTGAPAGIGLAATPSGTGTATLAPAGSSTGTIYLVGTVGSSGSSTVVVTPTDQVSGATGSSSTAAWTVFAAPTVNGLTTPLTVAAGATISAQSLRYTCPTSSCQYTVAGAPAGIGLSVTGLAGTAAPSVSVITASGTIYLVGTVSSTAPPTSYIVTVTPRDTVYAVNGPAATAAWTVVGATVTGLQNPFTTTVGATITPQALQYTCPSAGCTFTLAGAPAGIGIDTDTAGQVSSVVTVTGSTSGTLYLRGTVSGQVTPGAYTLTLTPRDTLNNAVGTPNQATWTVNGLPTVTGLTTPFTTTFGATLSGQQLPFTCPTSSCAFTVAGAPGSGVGLDTDNVGPVSNPLTVTGSTSGTIYLRGTVSASGAPSSTAYATDVRNQGASNYWRLGESSGSTGLDSIGTLPLTEQAGVGHGVGGAIASNTDTASPFDGSPADGAASTQTAIVGPQVFSESVWFRTTSTSGGRLLGFSNTLPANGISNNYDRQIYMENSGVLRFGTCSTQCPLTLATAAAYNDGQWHQAVGTLSGAGMSFYVDGSLVGTNTAVTSAQVFNGYWRLGGDNLNGWPGTASSQYFAGSLDDVSIYPTALTAAQIQQQYADSGRVPYTVTVTPADTASGMQGVPNQAAWTVDSPPGVTGLTTPFTTTAGATVANQPMSYSCPTNTCTVALTGAPAGIGISTAATGATGPTATISAATGGVLYLRGTVAASAAGPYAVAVTPTDTLSQVVGTAAQANWTVNAPPTVSGLTSPLTIPAGATVATQSLPYTCQTGSCTYTLAGAPTGIGLSGTTNGTPVPSVTVTATSGSIYLLGTVGTTVTPGSFTLGITSRDNGSGLTGNPATATWTVTGATVTGLPTPFTTAVGATVGNQSLTYSCPAAACSYTLAGAPTGIGLSTASTGAVGSPVTTAGPGNGTIYLRGVIGNAVTPGPYAVTITPKDTTDNAAGPANQAAWTVNPPPTVTGLRNPFTTTAGATIVNQSLPYTCPSGSCTFTVAGAPVGIGLSSTTGGAATSPLTVTGSPSGTLYLRGTVAAAASPNSSAYSTDVTGQGAYHYWRLGENGGNTATDSVGNLPLTLFGGVGPAPGALASSPNGAATFDGSSGYAVTQSAVPSPAIYSESVWFRTTSNTGGLISAMGVDPNGLSNEDRVLYLDNTGHVFFGQYLNTTVRSISTPGTYRDGTWHQAVATESAAGAALYLDGVSVATDPTITGTNPYSGYWRLGAGNLAGWPGAHTSSYVGASIDEFSVYTTALTLGQIQQQWADAHASTYAITVTPTDMVSAVDGTANQAAWTVNPPPVVSGLTSPFATNPNVVVSNQTLSYSCPSGACTIALTGAPTGIGISPSSTGSTTSSVAVTSATGFVYLRGTVGSSAAGTYNLAVTPTETTTSTVGTPAQATWTVNGLPTVTGLPSSASVSVGQVVGNISLGYTCPSGSCTFTIGGGLSGIGLDTDTAGPTTSSVSTSAASGAIYLRGTVTAAPGNYTVTVTPTDTASGVSGTANQAAGTVFAAPTTGSPGTVSKVNGSSVSQSVSYSCPAGGCTIVLSGYPSGIGLSTTGNANAPANSTTSITNIGQGSGTFYVQGRTPSGNSAKGTYTVTVTITDANGSSTSTSANWTIT